MEIHLCGGILGENKSEGERSHAGSDKLSVFLIHPSDGFMEHQGVKCTLSHRMAELTEK
jgi:hypothetical protein